MGTIRQTDRACRRSILCIQGGKIDRPISHLKSDAVFLVPHIPTWSWLLISMQKEPQRGWGEA